MAKFGKKVAKVFNHEGQRAYKLSDKGTLLQLASTCLMNEPKFYGKPEEIELQIKSLAEKIIQKDPEFILKLALYLRKEMYLRSVPMYLLSIAAHEDNGKEFVRGYTPKIISRADEICESVGCYLNSYGKPIPNSLKKGVNDSFAQFDEYQFAKYFRKANHPNFIDVARLTHPKEPKELLAKIMAEDLKTPYTWEVQLSEKDDRSKTEKWTELVYSGKMGYMATLRNLRNILDNVSDRKTIIKVCDHLKDENAVKRSKQFPFRFFSAYQMIKENPNPYAKYVIGALDRALALSFSNIPRMDGITFITSDVSGSMSWSRVSKNSMIRPYDIGILLSVGASKFTDGCIMGVFGSEFATISSWTSKSVLGAIGALQDLGNKVGHATNGHKPIDFLIRKKQKVDRVLMFSDMQLWNTGYSNASLKTSWDRYRREVNRNAMIYMFNLNAYGTVQLPANDRSVVNISGWSDKVFDFIRTYETDPEAQVRKVENYTND